MKKTVERYSSRKLIFCSIVLIIGFILIYLKVLDKIASDFLIGMTGIYLLGNVTKDVAKVFKKVK